jgi:ribosomal protein L14E/L6E/L27E
MKILMQNAILSALVFLLIPFGTTAQDYVLTTRGDSLTGEIKPLLYGLEKKVQLISADKNKTVLSLFEVREYSYEGDIFHPVKGETGYVFMKLIQPGYLSLYAFQPENQVRFDNLLLKKIDGGQTVVPNMGFKKFISKFLEDCPAVAQRIKEGELTRRNLTEVVEAYNHCITSRTINHQEIIAQRQEQKVLITTWDSLEKAIEDKDFPEKNNALEMISEIRKKLERQEKIPNFLVEGLKSSLQETGLSPQLDTALSEIGHE